MELKQCPWCKKKAVRWHRTIYAEGDSSTLFFSGCRNKDCDIQPHACYGGPWGYKRSGDLPDHETAIRKADEAWNSYSDTPNHSH